jgi:hypothetical protein
MGDKKIQFDRLIDYARGRLDPDERIVIEKNIEQDPILKKMVEVITGMKTESDRSDWAKLEKPSHDLVDRMLHDIKKRKTRGNEKTGINIYDSGLLPLPEGVRPAEVDTRRLKYLIDEAQIELSIYPISPKSFELIGRISGIEPDRPLTVELRSGKKKRNKIEANEFNLFRYPRISSGAYDLVILDGCAVVGKINFVL